MIPHNQNLALLVDATCERHPARPALFQADRTISYGELASLIDGWAVVLRARGVGAGDCVALWLPNGPAFVAAFHASLRIGAVVAPLGVLLAGREVHPRLEVARADLLVTTPALARQLGGGGSNVLVVDPTSTEFHLVSPVRSPPVTRAADDIAVLVSTSGTTGKAKAAELTHRGVTWNAAALATGLAMRPEDVQLAVAPLSHVLGMTGVMNASLITGAAIALMERFDAPAALALMEQTGTTGLMGAPPMFLALLREARRAGTALRLRFGMAGGAALAPSLTHAFEETFGCELRDGYGMSEVGGGVTLTPLTMPSKPGSVGPAMPGSELRIVDAATGAPLPAGESGEVAVRSPSLMRRYRDDDEATRAVLDDDGWLLTGDIGHLDGEGYLRLVDRKKDLIIRSGYNVYPREVEDVLLSHPGVLEAAVVGVPDDDHGEEVVALIVVAQERAGAGAPDAEAVKAFARERLAAYKYPRHVIVVADLPKGPTGKIAKRAIDRLALVAPPGTKTGTKTAESEP